MLLGLLHTAAKGDELLGPFLSGMFRLRHQVLLPQLQLLRAPLEVQQSLLGAAQLLGIRGVELHLLLVLLLRLEGRLLQLFLLPLQLPILRTRVPQLLLPVKAIGLQLHVRRVQLALEGHSLAADLRQLLIQVLGPRLLPLGLLRELLPLCGQQTLQLLDLLLEPLLLGGGAPELRRLLRQDLPPGLHRLPVLLLPLFRCLQLLQQAPSVASILDVLHGPAQSLLRLLQLGFCLGSHVTQLGTWALEQGQFGLKLRQLLLRVFLGLERLRIASSQ
mmetsp:Transcript_43486/g.103636  ORF Transcript_43486/g.103636 Transcript_43486/m.103636 type:complete len:275 (+) Transcript_43486:1276-2100(+)